MSLTSFAQHTFSHRPLGIRILYPRRLQELDLLSKLDHLWPVYVVCVVLSFWEHRCAFLRPDATVGVKVYSPVKVCIRINVFNAASPIQVRIRVNIFNPASFVTGQDTVRRLQPIVDKIKYHSNSPGTNVLLRFAQPIADPHALRLFSCPLLQTIQRK